MADAPQTFSESWYRIAGQRISLRPDVIVQRQNFRGERWIVLQNPFSNQFFRLRPAAYEFVARLRRERTVQEVWQECLDRFPDSAPGQESVIQLLSQLYFANLLQYEAGSDTAQLFERYERTRQRETRAKLLNVMFMRFPLLDPDQFLVRTLPIARALISPLGAFIWMLVVGAGIKVVIDHWTLLREQSQGVLAPSNLFLLYAGMVLVKTVHEFGHAYFCRRFGGEVHVMGIMLMIFTPMPYVDATSSWGFRNRWQRVLVGAAGMIVELFVAALATFVWANTGPGTLHSLAYNMMFVASVSTVVFNVNPLLRYDGYYILSDLIEIPNLYQKSLTHLKHLGERYLFGVRKSESPSQSGREKAWLTVYGVLSNIYRVVVFSGILLFVADRFLLVGIIMAAVCAISWVMVPTTGFVKYLAASPALERHRLRAVAVSCVGAALLLVFLDIVPFPNHFRAPGVLKSREWTEVVNESPGRVTTLLAPTGATVTVGQPLVQLKNEPLELDLIAAQAAYAEVQARIRQARQDDTASLKPLLSRLEATDKRVQRLQRDQASLIIKARQNGTWVSPQSKEFLGRWLVRGTDLGLIVDPSGFEFTATVAQEDGDSLFARKILRADARLFGQSERDLSLGPLLILPAEQSKLPSAALGWNAGGELRVARDDPQGLRAADPFFEVRAPVTASGDAALLHGRAGKIRFSLPSEPLLPRWLRRLRQLLQRRYQLVITPTQEFRRTSHHAPERLLKGLDASVNAMFGVYHRRGQVLGELRRDAEKVDALAPDLSRLSDHLLQERLLEYREGFRRGGRVKSELLIPALAAVREAADRKVGLRAFLVQLMGALALHRGYLVEMATGEGKTLTAGLAATLAGWTRHPCHIVTVNDYLVQRDAEWLKPLYSFAAVRVGFVTAAMDPAERRHGYECDLTYVTSKEVLADFLRDRLRIGELRDPSRRLIRRLLAPQTVAADGLVLRGLHTAIVDEADSVLIDEAVTPLIISTQHQNEALRQVVQVAQMIVDPFEPELDYAINHRYREVELTPSGHEKLADRCASLTGIWRGSDRRLELVRQALLAREFYQSGKQYVVVEGKIVIVDEFTGRPMPQRSWRQGMHQAIEAKEKVQITDPAETIARLSFQRYFRLYHHLSGMTGTAREAAGEFWHIYKLAVITIPTNKPCIRTQWPDRIFPDETSKWNAVVAETERIHALGRPILIGTRSVAASERLAALLTERGLYFRLLNAVRNQEEAAIVANAGYASQITIATNMAGRGTDIKLPHGVPELGGLHVIATERHESGRVDRQLFGRSARQGDPGSAQAFVSTEDELIRRYIPKPLQLNLRTALASGLPGRQLIGETAFTLAQRKAQRLAFRQRKGVLRMDDWLEEALSFTGAGAV